MPTNIVPTVDLPRQPDVVTLTSAVGACAKMKRWQHVVALFAFAVQRPPGHPAAQGCTERAMGQGKWTYLEVELTGDNSLGLEWMRHSMGFKST